MLSSEITDEDKHPIIVKDSQGVVTGSHAQVFHIYLSGGRQAENAVYLMELIRHALLNVTIVQLADQLTITVRNRHF